MYIGPINATRFEEFANGMNGGEKFALLDGEGLNGKRNGRALLHEQQRLQEGERIFAAGYANGDAVALTDHAEAADGFADLTQDGFFYVHSYPG